MAENEPQAPEPLPPEEATADSEAVKTEDDRYVGVDPIYKQSAYEEPLEVEAEGRSKAAKEAVQDELDMLARVKANEAGCVVEVDEPQPFEEWVGTSSVAARKAGVTGVKEDQVAADQEATEAAKDEDGKIPPHSTSVEQPGVIVAQ
jgi:hypothetical protein